MTEIIYDSAKSIAQQIREKKVSAVEVVEAHFRRIDEVNERLNAVVQRVDERALKEAKEADDTLARGELKGPLHGVPMTLKDSLDTEGVISTGGTKGRENFVPAEDATLVARLRDAGAILLGKTNTPEFTLAGETNNLVYGQTNNPFDLSRTTGGSSGGAGAIVTSGGSAFDIGSDTGGSIRFPAHFCGIAGIKPNTGRVPRTGHIVPYGLGAVDALTQNGPMARFVDDLTIILNVISGPDWRDPFIVPAPLGDPKSVSIRGLRVAVYSDNGIKTPTPETIAAVNAAAKALSDAGAIVTEDVPRVIAENPNIANELSASDGRAWTLRLIERAGTTEIHPWLQRRIDEAKEVSVGEFTAILERVDAFRSDMLGFMESYDVIVSPVCAFPAVLHGMLMDDEHREGMSYAGTYNITGWPGAVVRGGTSPEGLPIGVQVVSRPWREDVALAVAKRLEVELGGWQRPPI